MRRIASRKTPKRNFRIRFENRKIETDAKLALGKIAKISNYDFNRYSYTTLQRGYQRVMRVNNLIEPLKAADKIYQEGTVLRVQILEYNLRVAVTF